MQRYQFFLSRREKMKFLVAFVAVVAVAVASPLKGNKPITNELSELEAIIAAIQSPSTDPATAALLEEQLQDILGIKPEPVIVAPEIVEYEPIAVGPEIIDFPLPDGGAVSAPIVPSPVVIGELEAGQNPLVQVIINVNPAAGPAPAGVGPAPAIVPEINPTPVIVVDEAAPEPIIPEPIQVAEPIVPEPIQVAEPIIPEPIQVAEPIIPEPIQVAEPILPEPILVAEPIIVEPVVIGTPIIPSPAVLPDDLN